MKSQSPQFSKMFATKPKPGNVDSTENQHISDQSAYRVEKSQGSSGSVMDEEAKTCQLSEGSQEFVVHNETEVEQGNQASEEHENQASEKHGSGDVNVSIMLAWLNIVRIIPEFRIMRLTFHVKSALKY